YGHGINPDILMDRFNNNYSLLEEIYLKLISCDKQIDSDGRYIIYFIQKNISFIDKFIKLILLDEGLIWNDGEQRLTAIWNCENYVLYADYIYNTYFYNENLDKWQIDRYIGHLLKAEKKSEETNSRQDEWLTHFIENNYNNAEFMKIIFSVISNAEFSHVRRKKHILHFMKLNPDPLIFDEIPLEPS